uniref:Uncharacterized protein n=1 Tax=Rhizophora mucronata TaxID=61149 RepID=A0A2P2QFA6_RHIMU
MAQLGSILLVTFPSSKLWGRVLEINNKLNEANNHLGIWKGIGITTG